MGKNEMIEISQETVVTIRLKSTERPCLECEAVLVLNENEQCYECLNCGYIDCGDEEG